MLVGLEIQIGLQDCALLQVVDQADRQAGLVEQAQGTGLVVLAALARKIRLALRSAL